MEALDKELIRHRRGDMVHHPLVTGWVRQDASPINQTLRRMKEKVAKAESDGDWHQYVFLHEKPYRLDALESAAKKGLSQNPSDFWRLVGEVWQDSENIHQNLAKWKRLWGKLIENRVACMSTEDRLIFESLPDQVEVWRGTNHKRGLGGLSWTLDQEKAAWFANRFSNPRLVVKGLTNKRDIVAYFGERDEREIVSMRVSIISVTDVSPSDERGMRLEV